MLTLMKQVLSRPFAIVRAIFTSAKLSSDEIFTHRDSVDNNNDTPFEFTNANLMRLAAMIQNYPVGAQRSAVGAALDLVQRQMGWIPISGMHKVADILNIPRIRVYEFATFYTMNKRFLNVAAQNPIDPPQRCTVADILNIPRIRVYEFATFYTMNKRRYRGKFNVKVCVTTPCMLRGSDVILRTVEEATCCVQGGLSPDGMFGVETVECQGACVNAPVIAVDDDYYEDVNVCDVYKIIECLKKGGIPPPGPQNGRFAAEPICGPTTLLECPPGPGFCMQPALWSPDPPPPPPPPPSKKPPPSPPPKSPPTCPC